MEESVLLSLLNLKKTDIESINATKKADKTIFLVKLNPRDCSCPNCHSKEKNIKGYYNTTIRHAIALDQQSQIILNKRRYKCQDCGTTYSEPNPFVSNCASISSRTEISIMRDLKDPSITYSYLARKHNISATQVIRIFDKYISYGRNTLPTNLSIDEVYISPSSNYKYACILYDYDTHKIVDIIAGRRKADLDAYFSNIPKTERDKVLHTTADMWDTYRDASLKYFPNAVHSVDSFHVIKLINEKLNSKRVQVMNRYKGIVSNKNSTKSERNEASRYYYLYKNFHKLLLASYANLEIREKRYNRVWQKSLDTNDLIDLMLDDEPALLKLWELKEEYLRFNSDTMVTQQNAPEKLDEIINHFTKAAIDVDGLNCCSEIAGTLTKWRQEIINSFPKSLGDKRYHNGIAESCNAIIKKVIIASNGITNFKRFRNRMLYCMDPSSGYTHVDRKVAKLPNITTITPKNASAASSK